MGLLIERPCPPPHLRVCFTAPGVFVRPAPRNTEGSSFSLQQGTDAGHAWYFVPGGMPLLWTSGWVISSPSDGLRLGTRCLGNLSALVGQATLDTATKYLQVARDAWRAGSRSRLLDRCDTHLLVPMASSEWCGLRGCDPSKVVVISRISDDRVVASFLGCLEAFSCAASSYVVCVVPFSDVAWSCVSLGHVP
jgi:hypothetical protein